MNGDVDWSVGVPLMAGPFQIGLYEPSPETVGYWEGIKAEKLMIKRCLSCNRHQHPRRLFCSLCDSDRFEWVEASGTGTVYSFSTVHRAPRPEFDAEVPYTVGILELPEGIYLFSRILPPPGGEVKIGARARLRFQKTGPSGKLPAFQILE
jgi:uncharacterized OB-fold protein